MRMESTLGNAYIPQHSELEYAASVWDPYLVKDIQRIKEAKKKRIALRVCMKDWNSSYDI